MDGKGNDRKNDMYHYIDDKEFLKKLRSCCSDIINQLVQQINSDGKICVEAHLVGSGARNMITQNADEPIDLDYNLCILETQAINMRNEKALKNYIKSCFNDVLQRNRWGDCQDSTSALTTLILPDFIEVQFPPLTLTHEFVNVNAGKYFPSS